MTWFRFCDCAQWVEAQKCAGNTSPLRLFVHQDQLPGAQSWFAYDSDDDTGAANCWSVDPSDARECMPGEDGVHVYEGPFPWTHCTECEADPGDDGTGYPIGGGGLDDPWFPFPGGTPRGVKVSVCSDHRSAAIDRGWDVDHLYLATEDAFDQAFVTGVQGICVQVPTDEPVSSPSPAYWIGTGRRFDTCGDCTQGVQCQLCPEDQSLPGADRAPELWVREVDLVSLALPGVFAYGVWCYLVPSGPIETIPSTAIIYRPSAVSGQTCATCNRGVKYELCPGVPHLPGTPEYWADGRSIHQIRERFPDKTVIYNRIRGACYQLDLTADFQRIPTSGARIIWARLQFASCHDCQCLGGLDQDLGNDRLGYPASLCSGEAGGGNDLWVLESAAPSSSAVFLYGNQCYTVDGSGAPSLIPDDATVLGSIASVYDDCAQCQADRGSGDGGDDDPPPPPPPPPPPQDPPPPPEMRYFQLYECSVGYTTKWTQLPRYTRIRAGKIGGVCYAVIHPGRKTLPAGGQVVGLSDTKTGNGCGSFSRCECEPCYTIQDCNYELLPRTVDNDLSAHVGEVGFLNDRCWEVSEGDAGGLITQFNPDQWYADCAECKQVYWLVGDICDSGYTGGSLYTRQDFSAHLGKFVKVNGGDNCFEVRKTSDTGQALSQITVDAVFDSCAGCQPSCCTCGDCEFDDESATVSNYVWEGSDTEYYGDGACNPPALKITTRFTQNGPATRLGCGRWSVPLTYFQEILDPDGNTSTDGPFPAGAIEVKLNCGTMEWTGGQQGEVASGSCSGVNYSDVDEYCNGPNYRTEINWSFDITGNAGCDDMP